MTSTDRCECETGERTPLNCWFCSLTTAALDIDRLHDAMEQLMIRHEADGCRQIDTLPDGTAMFLLTTGQVYQYTTAGECRQSGHLIMQPVSDFDGVQYVPFVHRLLGTVGFVIIDDTESAERPVQFVYYSPRDHSEDESEPTIVLYKGGTGYPEHDAVVMELGVWAT